MPSTFLTISLLAVPDLVRKHADELLQPGPPASSAHLNDGAGLMPEDHAVWATTVMEQDIESVWRALNSPGLYAHRVGRLDVSEVIEGPEHGAGRTVVQRVSLPVIADRYWVVEHSFNAGVYASSEGRMWELGWQSVDAPAPARVQAQLEDARKVEETRGSWLLVPVTEDQTWVRYTAHSDPGGLPAAWVGRISVAAARGLLVDVERLASTLAPTEGYVRPDGRELGSLR